ncbi:hypothetical protein KL930_000722 [Ogataea haglerorum]|uniref:Uncharacterized protein n=1 Tax=Ogataea haglerorum TaxID=1937702 RepID=A0AAN6I2T2_9ASCO|nr:uncharacterized protein KL911_003405 [Ogataea haglerorum]KAG7700035.1 hypothetical protein KL915_000724 [Ogataea haglerorum]KAG7711506.1 hypothetical protein KL914_000148 [Ogataea haglerorum]KAG7712277.1 hypothetical protein KL950_000148 [Ogataea haglerorum]KAG7730821.1 hypothetical protein KL933_000616 [Ogataea haglerorum]KAG7734583.1 hypothetical protein KL948_000149 [Ogataea haglerorum]
MEQSLSFKVSHYVEKIHGLVYYSLPFYVMTSTEAAFTFVTILFLSFIFTYGLGALFYSCAALAQKLINLEGLEQALQVASIKN